MLGGHDVFADVGLAVGERRCVQEVQHEIITSDIPPIRQQAQRIPFALREKLTEMVGVMLRGVVRKSRSPSASW